MARAQPPRPRRAKTRPLPLFQQMTIVGVGLIGGSLGMICKQQGLVKTIVGGGRRVENLKKAVEWKVLDRYATDLAEAAAGSDLFVLATPVGTFEAALRACASRLARGARAERGFEGIHRCGKCQRPSGRAHG